MPMKAEALIANENKTVKVDFGTKRKRMRMGHGKFIKIEIYTFFLGLCVFLTGCNSEEKTTQIEVKSIAERMANEVKNSTLKEVDIQNEKKRDTIKQAYQSETEDFLNIVGEQYSRKKVKDGYEVKLYDKRNKEVYSDIYPKAPWINEKTDDILEIGVSTGITSSYKFYFNKEDSKMSDIYYNSILVGNKYIAYMENDKELVIIDMFDEGILNMEIEREFMQQDAFDISAIYNVELIDDENILLEYYVGEDYDIVSEIIEITRYVKREDGSVLETAKKIQEAYRTILAEYDRVWQDADYTMEKWEN